MAVNKADTTFVTPSADLNSRVGLKSVIEPVVSGSSANYLDFIVSPGDAGYDDPYNVVLPSYRRGEQPFDGGPIIAGSHKAALEGAIILCFVLKELELNPKLLGTFPSEEDEMIDCLDHPVPKFTPEVKKKIQELPQPEGTKKLLETWLEELLKKMAQLHQAYAGRVKELRNNFRNGLANFGTQAPDSSFKVSDAQMEKMVALSDKIVADESRAPADHFLQYVPRMEPIPPGVKMASLEVAIARPMEEDRAQRVKVLPPVAKHYVRPEGQSSLNRMLHLQGFYVAEFGMSPPVSFSKLVRENLNLRFEAREKFVKELAECFHNEAKHLPPAVREKFEERVLDFMLGEPAKSTAPQPTPGNTPRKPMGPNG